MTDSAKDPERLAKRDNLGRVVRGAWVRWAMLQPNPKPSWLLSYDELTGPEKEVDRQIGEAVLEAHNAPIARLTQERDGEREARHKLEVALREKDKAMGVLFERLTAAGIDYSDLIP